MFAVDECVRVELKHDLPHRRCQVTQVGSSSCLNRTHLYLVDSRIVSNRSTTTPPPVTLTLSLVFAQHII